MQTISEVATPVSLQIYKQIKRICFVLCCDGAQIQLLTVSITIACRVKWKPICFCMNNVCLRPTTGGNWSHVEVRWYKSSHLVGQKMAMLLLWFCIWVVWDQRTLGKAYNTIQHASRFNQYSSCSHSVELQSLFRWNHVLYSACNQMWSIFTQCWDVIINHVPYSGCNQI